MIAASAARTNVLYFQTIQPTADSAAVLNGFVTGGLGCPTHTL